MTTKREPITYSYDRYKETVKKCVSRYQKRNRPKLNEYMKEYLSDPQNRERHKIAMKKYRAKKKKEKLKKLKDEEDLQKLIKTYGKVRKD